MQLLDTVRIALQSLLAGKLRAALTMLGVIIGVAAVVALISVGEAVQTLIVGRFDALGANLLFVYAEQPQDGRGAAAPLELSNADMAALADPLSVPGALAVGAQYLNPAVLTAERRRLETQVAGTTANFPQLRSARAAAGRFFTQAEVDTRARVVVLGSAAAQALFGAADPVGARVRINDMNFEVIGVLAERGSTFGAREDDRAFVPLSTAQQRLFPPPPGEARRLELSVIYVQVAGDGAVRQTTEQIAAALRARRGLTYEDNNFRVLTQSDLIGAVRAITGALTLFLGSVAAISLVVGGIGIMNIMLVAVSERTREIGIRRAVGARRSDIVAQFLAESIVLSLTGGLIGLGLGAAIVGVSTLALRRFAAEAQASVDPATVAMAMGTSISVGLIFGIYPAIRAAGLQPVDALRAE